jgi:hypothetical protein
MIDIDSIRAAAMKVLAEPGPREEQELPLSAVKEAAAYEVCHTLAFTVGLLSEEEKASEATWGNIDELIEELTARLGATMVTPQQMIAYLTLEYEFGLRVGFELGRGANESEEP